MIVERELARSKGGAVASTPPGAKSRTRRRDLFPVVVAVLSVAALAELLLVRTFYRVGIFIPKEGPFRAVYRVLTEIGSFAFNLSSVLVVVALGLLVTSSRRHGRTATAVILGLFVAASLAAVVARAPETAPAVRLTFALAVVAVAAPFVRGNAATPQRAAVGTVAIAILFSSFAGFAGDARALAPSSPAPPGTTLAQLTGEAVALAAASLLFVAWIREDGPRRGPIIGGILAAFALFAAWSANGAITGILVLWTTGMRLYLPVWVYVVAMGAFSAAAIGWRRVYPWRAAGMVLLLVAGFSLDSTYLQMLGVLSLILITDGEALGGLPEWRRGGQLEPQTEPRR